MKRPLSPCALLAACLTIGCLSDSWGIDHVTWQTERGERQEKGRVIVTALDGGLLFESRDGTLWSVQPDQLIKHVTDDEPFEALQGKPLEEFLLQELGAGFSVHRTLHYTVLYNTTPEYAKWCAGLYERLHAGFYNYWKTRGLRLQEPELPLVAVAFRDQASYLELARRELGASAEGIVGYYSLHSNRIYTYDLTGADQRDNGTSAKTQAAHIQRILSRPQAMPLVATLIHEATHQLSYNSGLQSRYVDNPLWVSEGLAVFFETPDLGSDRGWRTIGRVNEGRLIRFRQYLPNRPLGSLADLLTDDQRMRTADTAIDGYAEAWAFCYFLLKIHPREFTTYLQALSARPPLSEETPDMRRETFERCFHQTIEELDEEFLRYITRLKS